MDSFQPSKLSDWDEVFWGSEPCSVDPLHPGECLLEGVVYCLDCVELIVDRWVAVHMAPKLRGTLPPLFGR